MFGVADHPPEYAARGGAPGIAFAPLHGALPEWLEQGIGDVDADAVLVTPHWGPNMTLSPAPYIRRAARALLAAGATLVAGHSAHVVHGAGRRVVYDLGDFLDDYRVDLALRNDLGLLFLVTLGEAGPTRIEAVPLELGYCRTGLATGSEAAWIEERFRRACAELGTETSTSAGRLVVEHQPAG